MIDSGQTRRMLLGRQVEAARIEGFVATVADRGAEVLLLTGEPGVGKTVLLDHAADTAAQHGLRVVRLAGVQAESAVPFAAVQRLLQAVGVPVAVLPPLQRQTLGVAFGEVEGPPPDRFRIGAAVRSALEGVAAAESVLVLVDDVQWLDPDSREVLGFAARRLHESGLGLLLAERTDDAGPGPFEGLPVLAVPGLPRDAAVELLERVLGRVVDPPIADRIVTATGGNPLALVELAPSLSTHQLVGGTLLPEPLPIGPTLERHYLRRVRALPPATRTWLLVAATAGSGAPELIGAAAAILGVGLDAAAPAEDDGLVRVGARVAFRHPLVGAAVYAGATADDRRRAHRAVAHALGEGTIGQAWHLGAATSATNEAVASLLEAAGQRAAGQGGQAARARLLRRAAELSPAGPVRVDRQLGAAEALTAAGYPGQAAEILEELPVDALGGAVRGRALLARAGVWLVSGLAERVQATAAVCVEAADAFAGVDPDQEVAAVLRALELLLPVELAADGTDAPGVARRALAALDRHGGPDTVAMLLVRAMSELAVRPYAEAAPAVRRAVAALLDASPELVLRHATIVVAVTTAAFDDTARHLLLHRAATEARRTGALQLLHSMLWMHAQTAAVLGRPDLAGSLLEESRATGRTMGVSAVVEGIYANPTGRAWEGGADSALVHAEIAGGGALGRAIGMAGVETLARHAHVLLDLADGRFAEAHATASAIHAEGFLQVALIVLPDLAEAAASCGRDDDLVAAAGELTAIAEACGTDLAHGYAARARALVAIRRLDAATRAGAAEDTAARPGGDAHVDTRTASAPAAPDPGAAFRESADHLTRTIATGELARTRLLHGEWLRRAKRRREAREHLQAALAMFEELGARPFAARARRELQATGGPTANGGLTPQETSVAELAATGATNVEIATRLSLSRHTVDYHLRKVFRKLDVTDRRRLHAALRTVRDSERG